MPPDVGLYVHIPFCHVKCRFCDFAAFPGMMKSVPRYLSALDLELQGYRGYRLGSLYIGGGTPSVLTPSDWTALMDSVSHALDRASDWEATVECNPENTTREKLAAYLKTGINRLSFGLQAAQDHLLKGLGRQHDFADFRRVFRQARAAGFANLNVDLMYGLPGQSFADWKDSLDSVLELEPDHISAYALTVEDRTAFGRSGVRSDDEFQADLYEYASVRLQAAGYDHYEISNFARPGFESRHNLRYWKNEPCLQAGVSASGYLNGVRRKNTERIPDYIQAVENGQSPVIEELILNEEDRVGEDLMLALRLRQGAEVSPAMRQLYGPVLNKYVAMGLLRERGTRVVPTLTSWLLSNQISRDLLTPPELSNA